MNLKEIRRYIYFWKLQVKLKGVFAWVAVFFPSSGLVHAHELVVRGNREPETYHGDINKLLWVLLCVYLYVCVPALP